MGLFTAEKHANLSINRCGCASSETANEWHIPKARDNFNARKEKSLLAPRNIFIYM
jgi:hypothetical protein